MHSPPTTRAWARAAAVAILLVSAAGAVPCGALPGARAAGAQSTQEGAATSIPAAALLEPGELVRILQSRGTEKPLIFQVGPHLLYKEAHIPGAESIGAASKDEGLRQLHERVRQLPHSRFIVLYCGCCPWSRCPNVKPAYAALRNLGFTNVKVLHIEQNFGTNWVQKGYPTEKGE